MTEACWQVREATERLKDGEDTRIREAERGDSLRAQPEGLLQEVERIAIQRAVMTHAFDREQGAVDLITYARNPGRRSRALRTSKSLGLLIVSSVRRPRPSLKYCFR